MEQSTPDLNHLNPLNLAVDTARLAAAGKLTPKLRLELYALSMQASLGDNTNLPPPAYDAVGRERFSAWSAVRGLPAQEARHLYLAKIEALTPPATASFPAPAASTPSTTTTLAATGAPAASAATAPRTLNLGTPISAVDSAATMRQWRAELSASSAVGEQEAGEGISGSEGLPYPLPVARQLMPPTPGLETSSPPPPPDGTTAAGGAAAPASLALRGHHSRHGGSGGGGGAPILGPPSSEESWREGVQLHGPERPLAQLLDPPRPAPPLLLLAGYLLKQREVLTSLWRPRWVVLQGRVLSYFESREAWEQGILTAMAEAARRARRDRSVTSAAAAVAMASYSSSGGGGRSNGGSGANTTGHAGGGRPRSLRRSEALAHRLRQVLDASLAECLAAARGEAQQTAGAHSPGGAAAGGGFSLGLLRPRGAVLLAPGTTVEPLPATSFRRPNVRPPPASAAGKAGGSGGLGSGGKALADAPSGRSVQPGGSGSARAAYPLSAAGFITSESEAEPASERRAPHALYTPGSVEGPDPRYRSDPHPSEAPVDSSSNGFEFAPVETVPAAVAAAASSSEAVRGYYQRPRRRSSSSASSHGDTGGPGGAALHPMGGVVAVEAVHTEPNNPGTTRQSAHSHRPPRPARALSPGAPRPAVQSSGAAVPGARSRSTLAGGKARPPLTQTDRIARFRSALASAGVGVLTPQVSSAAFLPFEVLIPRGSGKAFRFAATASPVEQQRWVAALRAAVAGAGLASPPPAAAAASSGGSVDGTAALPPAPAGAALSASSGGDVSFPLVRKLQGPGGPPYPSPRATISASSASATTSSLATGSASGPPSPAAAEGGGFGGGVAIVAAHTTGVSSDLSRTAEAAPAANKQGLPSTVPAAAATAILPAPPPAVVAAPQSAVKAPPAPLQMRRLPQPALSPPYGGRELEEHMTELLRLADPASNGPSAVPGSPNGPSWRSTGTSHGGAIACFAPTDSQPGCKGVGLIPFPRRLLFRALTDMGVKAATDEQFESGREVQRLSPHDVVMYWRFKGRLGVHGRDFVNFNHWRVQPGTGTLVLVAWSVPHSGAPGPGAGTSASGSSLVRARALVGGWVVRPLPGAEAVREARAAAAASRRRAALAAGHLSPSEVDAREAAAAAALPPVEEDPALDSQGCEVTYLMRSDFGGTMPGFLTRQIAAQQAALVGTTRDAIAALVAPSPGLAGALGAGVVALRKAGTWGPEELARCRGDPMRNEGERPAPPAGDGAAAAVAVAAGAGAGVAATQSSSAAATAVPAIVDSTAPQAAKAAIALLGAPAVVASGLRPAEGPSGTTPLSFPTAPAAPVKEGPESGSSPLFTAATLAVARHCTARGLPISALLQACASVSALAPTDSTPRSGDIYEGARATAAPGPGPVASSGGPALGAVAKGRLPAALARLLRALLLLRLGLLLRRCFPRAVLARLAAGSGLAALLVGADLRGWPLSRLLLAPLAPVLYARRLAAGALGSHGSPGGALADSPPDALCSCPPSGGVFTLFLLLLSLSVGSLAALLIQAPAPRRRGGLSSTRGLSAVFELEVPLPPCLAAALQLQPLSELGGVGEAPPYAAALVMLVAKAAAAALAADAATPDGVSASLIAAGYSTADVAVALGDASEPECGRSSSSGLLKGDAATFAPCVALCGVLQQPVGALRAVLQRSLAAAAASRFSSPSSLSIAGGLPHDTLSAPFTARNLVEVVTDSVSRLAGFLAAVGGSEPLGSDLQGQRGVGRDCHVVAAGTPAIAVLCAADFEPFDATQLHGTCPSTPLLNSSPTSTSGPRPQALSSLLGLLPAVLREAGSGRVLAPALSVAVLPSPVAPALPGAAQDGGSDFEALCRQASSATLRLRVSASAAAGLSPAGVMALCAALGRLLEEGAAGLLLPRE